MIEHVAVWIAIAMVIIGAIVYSVEVEKHMRLIESSDEEVECKQIPHSNAMKCNACRRKAIVIAKFKILDTDPEMYHISYLCGRCLQEVTEALERGENTTPSGWNVRLVGSELLKDV